MKVVGRTKNIRKYLILLSFSALLPSPTRAQSDSEEKTESGDSGGAKDTAPDGEKAASGRLVHRTGESASRSGADVQVELKMQNHPEFKDFRNIATQSGAQLNLPTNPAQPAKLHLIESEFNFRMAALGYAQRGAYLSFVGALPFRYLSSSDKNTTQGSEFAGYEVGIEGTPLRGIVLRSTVADRRSGKLQLIDHHYEWKSSLRYQSYESLGANISLGAKFGPQYLLSFKQDTNAYVRYGRTAGAMADVLMDIRSSGYIVARVGAAVDLERVLNYQGCGYRSRGLRPACDQPLFRNSRDGFGVDRRASRFARVSSGGSRDLVWKSFAAGASSGRA